MFVTNLGLRMLFPGLVVQRNINIRSDSGMTSDFLRNNRCTIAVWLNSRVFPSFCPLSFLRRQQKRNCHHSRRCQTDQRKQHFDKKRSCPNRGNQRYDEKARADPHSHNLPFLIIGMCFSLMCHESSLVFLIFIDRRIINQKNAIGKSRGKVFRRLLHVRV